MSPTASVPFLVSFTFPIWEVSHALLSLLKCGRRKKWLCFLLLSPSTAVVGLRLLASIWCLLSPQLTTPCRIIGAIPSLTRLMIMGRPIIASVSSGSASVPIWCGLRDAHPSLLLFRAGWRVRIAPPILSLMSVPIRVIATSVIMLPGIPVTSSALMLW